MTTVKHDLGPIETLLWNREGREGTMFRRLTKANLQALTGQSPGTSIEIVDEFGEVLDTVTVVESTE